MATESTRAPSLRYLYLGFYSYCHPRLEYKLQFSPNQLLCPYTLQWVPSDNALQQMARSSGSVHLGRFGFLSWLWGPENGAYGAQTWVRAAPAKPAPSLLPRAHSSAPSQERHRKNATAPARGVTATATPAPTASHKPPPAGGREEEMGGGPAPAGPTQRPQTTRSAPHHSCPSAVAGMTVVWQGRVLRFEVRRPASNRAASPALPPPRLVTPVDPGPSQTLCMITQPPAGIQDALLLLVRTLGRPLAEKLRYLIPEDCG